MISSNISLYKADDPYELLISQILRLERQPQDRLKEEQSTQEKLKSIMSDLDSNLSSLRAVSKELKDPFNTPFRGRSVSVPDTSIFTASASDSAATGSHSLEILRLASADTRVSKQLSSTGSDLRDLLNRRGAQTFTINVAHPTDADPANRHAVSVTLDPAQIAGYNKNTTTNEELVAELSRLVNKAMDDAVEAGSIKKLEAASASSVSETSTTTRLSLRSGDTGYDNRLEFTDSANGLLALLEVDRTTVATGTGGGAVKAVGTSETTSELNSKFILDGLTLYRNHNKVTDALDGLTLDLKKAGQGAVEFSVGIDDDGIKTSVKDFITKFNAALTYMQGKMSVDAETEVRGPLAGDSTLRTLLFGLRNDAAEQVDGQPAGGPKSLVDLGIEFTKSGELKLADEAKLLEAIEENVDAVESLFSSSDGVATRLVNRIERFVGVDAIIDERSELIDTRINRLKSRITDWDDRMKRREEQLREQFAKMQEAVAMFQGQQQYLGSFLGASF